MDNNLEANSQWQDWAPELCSAVVALSQERLRAASAIPETLASHMCSHQLQ